MFYAYDICGFYTFAKDTADERTTEVAPPAPSGGLEPNWTGIAWQLMKRVPIPAKTRDDLKAERQAKVDAIKVTTQAGNTFDGDEVSQGRMARAIIALGTGLAPSVAWVLADNSVIDATVEELTEALVLAGQAQAAVWVLE